MARKPSPWYWPERNGWYTILNGRRQLLAKHPADLPHPVKRKGKWVPPLTVERAFHALLASPDPSPEPAPEPSTAGLSVAEVFDKYLEWCEMHREARTFDWYRGHIQAFLDTLADQQMPVSELKAFHVVEWVDSHPDWGDAYRRGAIVAIQRPFNWAERLGYIDRSPVRNIEKPSPTRREKMVTPVEFAKIRDHYPEGDPFRDLLEFAWETGARPQEVRCVEARHVRMDNHSVEFPPSEAKGKKRWRIIYMTPRAEEIVSKLLALRPDGLLFLTRKQTPWTRFNMASRFQRLKHHLGQSYCGYLLRHGFATRKLEEGLDHLTVAALLGHKDSTMLSRIYSHIGERPDHLREQLNRTAASSAST